MTRNDRKAHNSNPGAGGPAEPLRAALAQRVVVADGAMGTMLQASAATLSDFDGHEGCNEVLNIARPAADAWAAPERPRWVLGSVGPGTKLPTLGHVRFAVLRDAYQANAAGLLRGG